MEDNMTAISVIKTGRNPNMSHMSRTHGINVSFLHEVIASGQVIIRHCKTVDMCADVFTKHFTNQLTWKHVVSNIAHVVPEEMWGKRLAGSPAVSAIGSAGSPENQGSAGSPDPPGPDYAHPRRVLLRSSLRVVSPYPGLPGLQVHSTHGERGRYLPGG